VTGAFITIGTTFNFDYSQLTIPRQGFFRNNAFTKMAEVFEQINPLYTFEYLVEAPPALVAMEVASGWRWVASLQSPP